MNNSPHIAVFLYSVDPLFHPHKYQQESYVIVAKDSPFFAFAQSLFPKEHILAIPMTSSDGHDLSERQMLNHPECLRLLKGKKITHLVVPSRCTKIMKDWAKEQQITLIGTPYALQNKLENKLYFDGVLKKYHLSSPLTLTSDTIQRASPPYVIQESVNWGLLGTTFCSSREAAETLIAHSKKRLLIRQYLDGMPIGVSILIDKKGTSVFSAIRRQCFLIENGFPTTFLGIQWIPTTFFPAPLLQEIYALLDSLAKVLIMKKFIGIANIDLIIHNNHPYILECNPRLSAATAQVFSVPEVTSISDPYAFFLNSFFNITNPSVTQTIPHSSYQGSFLAIDITDNHVIKHLPEIGVYELRNDRLHYIGSDMRLLYNPATVFMTHYLQKAGIYDEETEVSTIVSHMPLFSSEEGTFTPVGTVVFDYFMKAFF